MTSHATTESFRGRVQAFYHHYCPEKATSTHIDFIMDKYRGHEAEVISVLSEKYGPEPQPQSQPQQLPQPPTSRTFDQRPVHPHHYDQPRSAAGAGLQPSSQLQHNQRAHSPPGAARSSNRMEELGLSSPGTFGQFDGGSPPIIVKSRSADSGAAARATAQPMSRLDLIEAMARADAAKPRPPPPPPPPVAAAPSAVSTSQSHLHRASAPAPHALAPAPVATAPTPSRQTGHYSGLNTSSFLPSAPTPHQTAASQLPQPTPSMLGGGAESGFGATNTQQAADFARSSVLGGTAQISATSAALANALSQNQTPHHGQHQFPGPVAHPRHPTAVGAGDGPSAAGRSIPTTSGRGAGGTATSTTSEALAEALAVRQQQFARDLDRDTQREMDAHHDTLEAARVEKAQEIQRQELAIHELRNALKITTRQAKLEDDEARASAARTARELTRAKVSMMVLENQHLRLDSASPFSGLISQSNGGLLPSRSDGGGRVNINGTPMRTMPRDAPSDSSVTMLPSSSAHGAAEFAGATDLAANPTHSRRRDLDLGGGGGATIRVPSASLTARNTSLVVGGNNSNAAAVAGRIVAHGHAAANSSNGQLSGGGGLNQSLFDPTSDIDRTLTDTKETESKTPVTAHAFDRAVESALNAARDRAEVESRRHQLASVIRHHLTLHPLSAVFQTLTASNAFLAGELENIALRAPYVVSDELTQLAAARARERNGTNKTSEETAGAHLEDLRGTRVPKPEDLAAEAVKRLLQDPNYGTVPTRPTMPSTAPTNDGVQKVVSGLNHSSAVSAPAASRDPKGGVATPSNDEKAATGNLSTSAAALTGPRFTAEAPEVRKFGRTIPTESHSTAHQDPALLRTPEEIHRTQHAPSQQASSQLPPDALPTGLSAGVGAGGNVNATGTEEGLAFRDFLSHASTGGQLHSTSGRPTTDGAKSQEVPRAPVPEDLPEGLRRGPLPFAVTEAGPPGNDNGIENDDGQTPPRREVDIDGRTPIRLDII